MGQPVGALADAPHRRGRHPSHPLLDGGRARPAPVGLGVARGCPGRRPVVEIAGIGRRPIRPAVGPPADRSRTRCPSSPANYDKKRGHLPGERAGCTHGCRAADRTRSPKTELLSLTGGDPGQVRPSSCSVSTASTPIEQCPRPRRRHGERARHTTGPLLWRGPSRASSVVWAGKPRPGRAQGKDPHARHREGLPGTPQVHRPRE